jgi:hypothetical protein
MEKVGKMHITLLKSRPSALIVLPTYAYLADLFISKSSVSHLASCTGQERQKHQSSKGNTGSG